MDDIADCQHSLETIGWCMYMRGRDISHAEPVLLFECLDGKTRAKVVDIVKNSQLWKDIIKKHPALRLDSSSRGPQGSCSAADMPYKSDASNAVYCDRPLHQLHGVQIYVNTSQDSSPPLFRKATLGGLILVGDVLHALTVAHLFKDTPQPQTVFDETGDDFTFEDDSEMNDDISNNTTHRGMSMSLRSRISSTCMALTKLSYAESESSKSTHLNLDQNDSSIESESNSVEFCNITGIVSPMPNHITVEVAPLANVSAKVYLGSMKVMSNNTLDWAIVPIRGEYGDLVTSLAVPTKYGYTPLKSTKIADTEPISDEIWAITASKGPVEGRLSTVPYYLKISGSKTFQKTWMTYLETDLGL